eukprot:403360492
MGYSPHPQGGQPMPYHYGHQPQFFMPPPQGGLMPPGMQMPFPYHPQYQYPHPSQQIQMPQQQQNNQQFAPQQFAQQSSTATNFYPQNVQQQQFYQNNAQNDNRPKTSSNQNYNSDLPGYSPNIGLFEDDQPNSQQFYQQDNSSGVQQQLKFDEQEPDSYEDDEIPQNQQQLPLETIFEESLEDQDASQILQKKRIIKKSSSKSRTRGVSENERKRQEADQYLKSINKKFNDTQLEKTKNKMANDINSAVDISQMSEWSDDAQTIKRYKPNHLPDNIRLKDQEGLIDELKSLRQETNEYKDIIKLLKTEILKLRKPGQMTKTIGKSTGNNNYFDPNLMEPNDLEKLKEDVKQLKKELNACKEENKAFKAQAEQYKKRAYYAKNKFNDIKEKNTKDQDPQFADSQYRLKNTELKNQIKKMQEDYESLNQENMQNKIKLANLQSTNKFRDEYEKSQKLIKKLQERVQQLEAELEQNRLDKEMQREIEFALRKEDEEKDIENQSQLDKQGMLNRYHEENDNESSNKNNDSIDRSSISSTSNKENNKSQVKTILNQEQIQTKNYVSATLQAWNQCPSIVKKQLDEQSKEIKELKSILKEQELKLKMKKNDFDKVSGLEMKKDLMKHKEKIESIYRQKMEDEKRRILKTQMDEFEDLVKENKTLKDELGKIKVTLVNNRH